MMVMGTILWVMVMVVDVVAVVVGKLARSVCGTGPCVLSPLFYVT